MAPAHAALAQCPRGPISEFDGVGKIADAVGTSSIATGADFATLQGRIKMQ
jgi:hypothetical protein